jgi:hypothetical protein
MILMLRRVVNTHWERFTIHVRGIDMQCNEADKNLWAGVAELERARRKRGGSDFRSAAWRLSDG